MKWIWKGIAVLVIGSVPVFSWADSDEQSKVDVTTGTRITPTATSIFGTRYSRVIRLEHDGQPDHALLATYECWPSDFPFFRSEGDGHSWTQVSQMPLISPGGWNMRVEPDLLELPVEMGGLPAGTILLAGNAWNDAPPSGEPNRHHDLWYSLDQGLSWHFRGTIEVQDDSRNVNIWEPRLAVTGDGRLACYYSEERNAPYNQVLAMRISDDAGLSWGSQSLVCAIPDSVQRPGMPVVTKMDNGTYVMSFEAVGKAVNSHQVHVKFSPDGIDWGDPTDYGTPVQDANGDYPAACPTITWTSAGGSQGTLIITAAKVGGGTPDTDRKLFLNTNGGSGDWTMQPAPVQWQGGNILSGWSQGIIPTRDQQGLIQLAPSSITIDGSDEYNEMLVGRQQLIVPGVSYTVRNENSRLRLEVPAGSSVLGTRFQQAELTKYTRQRWAFSSLDDNVWMVTNEGNGLVWDHNWEPVAGDPVFQWDYNALLPQQWRLVPTGRGPWKVLSGAGENLALSVAGGSIASGALIELAAEAAVPQQEWLPVEVGSADAAPPSAPVGLSAVDGDGKVRLEWSANSETDLAGYSVARASSSGGPYQVIASGVSGSAFTDITVDNGSIYYYVVTAVDAALNESGRSVEVTGVPDAIPELTAFYDLDGNMLDGSGNNHHAGSYGFPVYESGAIGRSVVLDGSDDFAVLPFGLADFDDMTFACWVNWTGSGGDWQRIFDFGNDTTQNLFLTPRSGAGTLRFGIRNGGDEQMTETSGLPSGTWVHVAVTLQGNVATIYVNGTPAASNSGTTINPSDFHPALNYLGKSHWPDPLFNGRLDEVYLCNYALSESEIVNLMNNHYPPSLEPAPLSIASGNGMIRVSWPDEFSGWRLQRKDALSMTNWIDVPDAETVSVMQFPEGTNAHMFFRMVYP